MKYLTCLMLTLLTLSFARCAEPTKTEDALKLAIAGQYEESEQILKAIKEDEITQYDFYHFARLLNNFATNNKAQAEKHAKALEDTFHNDLPTRYKALAYMMSEDLKHWKANDLGDIGRDMRMSSDRLDKAQGGEKTQMVQKVIVDKLDRLIKEQEDKANAALAAAKEKEEQARKKMPLPGQAQPAPESLLPDGEGIGRIDEKKLKQIAQNWGTLPEKERQKIIQEFTRELPAKYKPMIEEYYKALNNMPSKR